MLPPMNEKSIAATTTGRPSIVARSVERARLGLAPRLACAMRSGYGFVSVKERTSTDSRSPLSSSNAPLVEQLSEPLANTEAEVVVALRADTEIASRRLW